MSTKTAGPSLPTPSSTSPTTFGLTAARKAALYIPFMLLLCALIFRAVAIEFRSKQPMRWWRQMWDIGFSAGSLLSGLLLGVALGNIAWGVPIDDRGEFAGTFLGLLKPYPVLVGVTTVALFMMHGAIYGVMKTEGRLHDKLRGWAMNCIIFFVICAAMTMMATLLYVPHLAARVRDNPWLFSVALANMLAIANIPREFHHFLCDLRRDHDDGHAAFRAAHDRAGA